MNVLKANLKHLYLRRGLWLAYAVLACLIPVCITVPLDDATAERGSFVGLVALVFIVGMVAAIVQIELLSKPFTFCLPGHRQVVRTFIFFVGTIVNTLSCLLFLKYPGVTPGYVPVILASAFCAGMISYLAGVWLAFGTRQPLAFIGFLAIFFMGGRALNLHIGLENAIVTKPLAVVAIGFVAAGGMWLYLSTRNLTRRNCLRPFFGLEMAFNQEKIQRFQRTKGQAYYVNKLKDHPREWVETWFFNRMNRHSSANSVRFVWGSLYTTYAVAVSRWKNILFLIVFLAFFLGYMGGFNGQRAEYLQMGAFIGPIMILMQIRLPLYSTMPIAGGRDQRIVSTLVTVFVGWLCVALSFGSILLLSIPLARLLPDIHFPHLTFQYQAIDPQTLYFVLAILPVVYVAQLLHYKKPLAMMIVLMGTISLASFFSMASLCKSQISLSLGTAIALIVLLWAIFIGVLYRIARNRSLVR